MKVSVVICTFNSAKRLEPTLQHLKGQQGLNDADWEVIIVDHQSEDGTMDFARSIWSGSSVALRLFTESMPGKSPALETGFQNAQGEAICIIDDDNWVHQDYIFVANKVMSSQPDVGVVGAHGEAHCEIAPPGWFEVRKAVYAVGTQGVNSGYVERYSRYYFWGAGSVIRKSAWLKAKQKGFVPRLNPSRGTGSIRFKNGFTGGEDPELCYAIQYSGYRLWYEPALKYTHFIPANRLTVDFIVDAAAGVGAAAPLTRLYECQLYPNTVRCKVGRLVFQTWILHMVYILQLYFLCLWRFRGGTETAGIGRAVTHAGYLSQIRALWGMSREFGTIRTSIRALAK